MNAFLERFKQPSTYKGMGMIFALAGFTQFDGIVQAAGGVVIALIGLYEVIRNETSKPK